MEQEYRRSIESRNMYSCGFLDSLSGVGEGKPTAWMRSEGSSPVCDMASKQDTTGILDLGMYPWGSPGTWENQFVSL